MISKNILKIRKNLKVSNLALAALYFISIGGLLTTLLGMGIKGTMFIHMPNQILIVVSCILLFGIAYVVKKINTNLHAELKTIEANK